LWAEFYGNFLWMEKWQLKTVVAFSSHMTPFLEEMFTGKYEVELNFR